MYLFLFPPGLAAGFSITSLAIWARCAVKRSPCICLTRVLEGLKATVSVCMGIAGRPPRLAGVESCPKAAPGWALLLPSMPLAMMLRCYLVAWPSWPRQCFVPLKKRNHQPVFNVVFVQGSWGVVLLVQSPLLGALQGGCRTTLSAYAHSRQTAGTSQS